MESRGRGRKILLVVPLLFILSTGIYDACTNEIQSIIINHLVSIPRNKISHIYTIIEDICTHPLALSANIRSLKRTPGSFLMMDMSKHLNIFSVEPNTSRPDIYILTSSGIVRVSLAGEKKTIIKAHRDAYSLEIQDNNIYVSEKTRGGDIIVYDLEGNYIKTISIPSQANQYQDLTTLPDGRIALSDNDDDNVFFIDSSGNLLATTKILDSQNPHFQNLDGIVVSNRLILSEDGNNHIIQIDLDTYKKSIFMDLKSLPHWLGALTYAEGKYYICGPSVIYSFSEGGSITKVSEIPESNITGIAVVDNFAYVCVDFSGRIYGVDLHTGASRILASELNYPKDLECAEPTPTPSSSISGAQVPYSFILSLVLLLIIVFTILYVYRISKRIKKLEDKWEKGKTKLFRTSSCPICRNEIQEEWTVCPHCGIRLKWKPFTKEGV